MVDKLFIRFLLLLQLGLRKELELKKGEVTRN
jgi:hypothetical protein